MATSPCEMIANALANVYTMLTASRGFDASDDVENMFAHWSMVKKAERDTFAKACEALYRFGLLRKDEKKNTSAELSTQFNLNKHDAGWLALNARNLLFVHKDNGVPAHAGITYCMVLVVLTARSGDESLTKLHKSEAYMGETIENLKKQGFLNVAARVIRLTYGKPGKNSQQVTSTAKLPSVSTEYWFTSEMQSNPLEHAWVPHHIPFAAMTDEERQMMPESTRKAAVGDRSKLDRIRTFDIVARWCGYAPGQVIVCKRRQLFEGGENYHLRCVV